MIITCPTCETQANITHGDQIERIEICEGCEIGLSCPVCKKSFDSADGVAVHLEDKHEWGPNRSKAEGKTF